MYIADTHGLLWYLTNDERIGKKAEEIFKACDAGQELIVIPSIVLIELLLLCERKKEMIRFREIFQQLRTSSNYHIYPLDEEVIASCVNIDLKDPHDRIIVATTKLIGAPLITKDKHIKRSNIVSNVWEV